MFVLFFRTLVSHEIHDTPNVGKSPNNNTACSVDHHNNCIIGLWFTCFRPKHAVIQMWWFGDAQDRKNTQHVLKEPVLLSKLQALKNWGDQSNGVDTLKKKKTLSTYSLCSFFLSVSFFLFHCCFLPVRFLLGSLVRWHQSATSN